MKHLFLLLLLIGCGEAPRDWIETVEKTDPEKPLEPIVEREEPVPELKEIVDDFLYDCGVVHGANVSNIDKLESIKFGETAIPDSPGRIGVCRSWTSNTTGRLTRSTITIKPTDDEWKLRAVVYHELGHCVLRLDHDSEPLKIMSAYILSGHMYEEKWNELVEEMCRS